MHLRGHRGRDQLHLTHDQEEDLLGAVLQDQPDRGSRLVLETTKTHRQMTGGKTRMFRLRSNKDRDRVPQTRRSRMHKKGRSKDLPSYLVKRPSRLHW